MTRGGTGREGDRAADGLLVAAPLAEGEVLHWWQIAGGRIVAAGQDADPVAAAALADGRDAARIVALLPAAVTAISEAAYPDLSPRQAEVAARLAALDASIGGDEANHAVAVAWEEADPQPATVAVVDRGLMAGTLARLQRIGIDPHAVVPVALVVPASQNPVTAQIGGEAVLRAPGIAAADDPALTPLLVGGAVDPLPANAIAPLLEAGFAAPPLDLRQGVFARRRQRAGLDAAQIRRLVSLFAALIVLSLAVELVTLVKTWLATDGEDAAALAAIRTIAPQEDDLVAGERKVDALLAARGAGAAGFGVPASALFAAMQAVPGIAVRSLDYRADATLAATLAAPSSDAINAVLLALQARGYVVTANPRQDSTGSVVADITVRGS